MTKKDDGHGSQEVKAKRPGNSKRARLLARRARKNGKTLNAIKQERRAKMEGRRLAVIAESEARELAKKREAVLSPGEHQLLRLANVERAPLHEIAAALNAAHGTLTWDEVRVSEALERARAKLAKAGELEAARPLDYQAQDVRLRYDTIVRQLRAELLALSPGADEAGSPINTSPLLIGPRAKLLKTIADVERMRDDVLAALSGNSAPRAMAVAYVSHLRQSDPPATSPAD